MEFDPERYKKIGPTHPLSLFWILNPAMAFNELVLGQRLPRLMLEAKTTDVPLSERTYVPCPACGALHDARLWTGRDAFAHWFGYVCPTCHARIPCLWNLTSLIVLVITFPIWIWFKRPLERFWIEREKQRIAQSVTKGLSSSGPWLWLRTGLMFGGVMFLVLLLRNGIPPVLEANKVIFLTGLCLLGGMLFGLFMRFFDRR
jgi:hypothetical protein